MYVVVREVKAGNHAGDLMQSDEVYPGGKHAGAIHIASLAKTRLWRETILGTGMREGNDSEGDAYFCVKGKERWGFTLMHADSC